MFPCGNVAQYIALFAVSLSNFKFNDFYILQTYSMCVFKSLKLLDQLLATSESSSIKICCDVMVSSAFIYTIGL